MSANPVFSLVSSPTFLRNVLRLDALSCLACGALQVALAPRMAGWLALPQPLVAYTGEFLLAWAALVFLISTRQPIPRGAVWLLIAGNLAWGLACVALLLGNAVQPSALGIGYIMLQALAVGLMAELQFISLRRQVLQPAW